MKTYWGQAMGLLVLFIISIACANAAPTAASPALPYGHASYKEYCEALLGGSDQLNIRIIYHFQKVLLDPRATDIQIGQLVSVVDHLLRPRTNAINERTKQPMVVTLDKYVVPPTLTITPEFAAELLQLIVKNPKAKSITHSRAIVAYSKAQTLALRAVHGDTERLPLNLRQEPQMTVYKWDEEVRGQMEEAPYDSIIIEDPNE